MATVGRGADQYTVRFPDGLRDRIKSAAEQNNRSMNAEIVATLEEKYPAPSASALSIARHVTSIIARASKEERDQTVTDIAELVTLSAPQVDLNEAILAISAARSDVEDYEKELGRDLAEEDIEILINRKGKKFSVEDADGGSSVVVTADTGDDSSS